MFHTPTVVFCCNVSVGGVCLCVCVKFVRGVNYSVQYTGRTVTEIEREENYLIL